jgi:HK97 family phage portal protein
MRLPRLFTRAAVPPTTVPAIVDKAPPPVAPRVADAGNGSSWPPFGAGWWSGGGHYPGMAHAENLSCVGACIQAISSALASLPAAVYRLDGDRRVLTTTHPLARLIRKPNSLQSWPDFIEWWVAQTLLYGNGLAELRWDGRGAISEILPIPWWQASPIVLATASNGAYGPLDNARLCFDVTTANLPWAAIGGVPRRLFADTDVLLLKDRSDTGLLGRPRLSRAPEVLSAALGAQGFSSNVWANGAMLMGTITHPGVLSKEAAARVGQSWGETHAGAPNAGKIAILEEGMKFEAHAASPEDAELLDSRRFSVEEIARIFNVPLPIINELSHSNFASADTATQWFGSLTLLPWVRKIEAEFGRAILGDDDYELSLDLSGLMRGAYAERIAAHVSLVRSGIISVDEARKAEGFDPLGGAAAVPTATAVGGRPDNVGDGQGDATPPPEGTDRGKAPALA